jgi:hypothetical protein
VPRLAIVISAVSTVEALETTLVSVLENLPRDCQVIVAANFPYEDPYDLGDEVQFLAAPGKANFLECANLGLRNCRAPLVNVLAAGCVVSEGWADAALGHFADPRVAAVAPLVLDVDRPKRVLAAGIGYRSGGARRQLTPRLQRAQAAGATPVLGACGFAAFLRRSALDAIGGWTSESGAVLADVELAWSLSRAGYRAICEPQSQVLASRTPVPRGSSFAQGLYAERLFWRGAGSGGWLASLAMHPFVAALDTLANLPNPGVLLRLLGRMWACCQVGHYVRHYHQLRREAEAADIVRLAPAAGRVRPGDGRTVAGQPGRHPSQRKSA